MAVMKTETDIIARITVHSKSDRMICDTSGNVCPQNGRYCFYR
jgi:hypothetical protein